MNWKIKSGTDKMKSRERLSGDFYTRDVLVAAPEVPGKNLVIRLSDGSLGRYKITEVKHTVAVKTWPVMPLKAEPPEPK